MQYITAKRLADNIEKNVKGYKPNTEAQLQSWADSVRLILEVDKRDSIMAEKLLYFSIENRPVLEEQYPEHGQVQRTIRQITCALQCTNGRRLIIKNK